MIAIIDYGMGNLHSVYNALQRIDCPCMITNRREDLMKAEGLILPGVGAFKDCMNNLNKSGLVETIKEEVQKGKPLLGICLGMQVLFEKGYEVEMCEGLKLLQGKVILMQDDQVKIPHIGWNLLEKNQDDFIFDVVQQNPYVYYVHSYYASGYDEKDLIAYSTYGTLKIPGYVRHNNILGMQFHPEKSGAYGLALLREFKEMCL